MKKSFLMSLIAATLLSPFSIATAADCHLFETDINVTVTGPGPNGANAVRETFLIRDLGVRDHPVEFLLYPGTLGLDEFYTGEFAPENPAAPYEARVGDIILMSNSALRTLLFSTPDFPAQSIAAAAVDLGTFDADNEGFVVFSLDPRANVDTQVNAFFALDGEGGGDPMAPPVPLEGLGGSAGTARLMFAGHGTLRVRRNQDGTLQGDINTVGAVIPSDPPLISQYQGTFTGRFLRTVAC